MAKNSVMLVRNINSNPLKIIRNLLNQVLKKEESLISDSARCIRKGSFTKKLHWPQQWSVIPS